MQDLENSFAQFTLSNGLRVVTQYTPFFPSVSLGLWIGAGSIVETPETNGYSHFIEHMLFKSTERRSTLEIASEIDRIGGSVNAFTSKECTCFYAKVITEHLPRTLDLLSDLLLNPRFDAQEMEKERGVILEEIAMGDDTPDDTVMDLLAEAWFGTHPLSMPIIGFREKIETVTRDELVRFRMANYRPDNIVLSIVGQFDSDSIQDLCEQYLGSWHSDCPVIRYPAISGLNQRAIYREKEIEQVHIAQAWQGVGQEDMKLYPLSVVCNLFGGGNASRLFQKIREEMGAVYTIYCGPSVYCDNGTVVIYAATSPEQAQEVSHTIHREIAQLRSHGITREEFEMSKEQLKVSYILGMESNFSRMSANGRSLLLRGTVVPSEQVLRYMNDVTLDQTVDCIESIFSGPYAAAAVGKNVQNLLL